MPTDAAVARGNVGRQLGLEADENRRPGRNIRRRKDRDSKIVAADAGAILVDIEIELVVDPGRDPDAGNRSPEYAERPRLAREPPAALQRLVEPGERRPAMSAASGRPEFRRCCGAVGEGTRQERDLLADDVVTAS